MNASHTKSTFTATLLAVALAATLSSPDADAARKGARSSSFFDAECATEIATVGMDGPTVLLHITGVCEDEVLGTLALDISQRVTPTGPADNGVLLPVSISNATRYTAGSGDGLNAAFTGTGEVNLVTGQVKFSGQHMFQGGTGQFLHTRGFAVISGRADQNAHTGYYSAQGVITY